MQNAVNSAGNDKHIWIYSKCENVGILGWQNEQKVLDEFKHLPLKLLIKICSIMI